MTSVNVQPPPDGTLEHRWWTQGAVDEARCRNEGLTAEIREFRETLEALARLRQEQTPATIAGSLARIYLAGRPLRERIELALQLVFR